MSIIPQKCVNCIHHKKSDRGTDYCDYTEYLDNIGCPVPYPYFFKQEYPCKGHEEKMVDVKARYTKKDMRGRYYIESINGKLESNIFGHTYGEAIDHFAELENACSMSGNWKECFEAAIKNCDGYKKLYEDAQIKIERLQSQVNRLKKYDKERDIALHARLISETRKKVAEEIIKDFEKLFYDYSRGAITADTFLDYFSTITMKYTGENADGL